MQNKKNCSKNWNLSLNIKAQKVSYVRNCWPGTLLCLLEIFQEPSQLYIPKLWIWTVLVTIENRVCGTGKDGYFQDDLG